MLNFAGLAAQFRWRTHPKETGRSRIYELCEAFVKAIPASSEDDKKENLWSSKVNSWINIVAIAARGYHTIGLRADGTVVAVGVNDLSQCDVSDWKLW